MSPEWLAQAVRAMWLGKSAVGRFWPKIVEDAEDAKVLS